MPAIVRLANSSNANVARGGADQHIMLIGSATGHSLCLFMPRLQSRGDAALWPSPEQAAIEVSQIARWGGAAADQSDPNAEKCIFATGGTCSRPPDAPLLISLAAAGAFIQLRRHGAAAKSSLGTLPSE